MPLQRRNQLVWVWSRVPESDAGSLPQWLRDETRAACGGGGGGDGG